MQDNLLNFSSLPESMTSPSTTCDVAAERQLLTALIDQRAVESPDNVWAETVLETSPLRTLRTTYAQLSLAVSFTGRLIEQAVGGPRATHSQQLALWYSGPSDIRFIIFLLAVSKTGHKSLFISPRNTILAHQRLLDATSCRYVFTSNTTSIQGVLDSSCITHVPMPSLLELFELCQGNIATMPSRSYDEMKDETFVILHTSGSTNYPKPISMPHRAVSVYNEWYNMPLVENERLQDFQMAAGQRLYCAFPLFHRAGIDITHQSFSFNFTLVFGPAERPPSVPLLTEMLQSGLTDSGSVPPVVLEDFVVESQHVQLLKSWRHVGTGGAALVERAGNIIAQHTQLRNLLGSTESAYLPELLLHKAREDWAYHCFHPALGVEYHPRSDNLYEAVIVRKPEIERFQMVFAMFPNKSEFATSDLFSKHPTTKDLWLYHGRTDNLITLSNGEKFAPEEADTNTSRRPDVEWALTVGDGTSEPGLLLMPAEKFKEEHFNADVRLEISTAANNILPKHAHIGIDHVWILDRDTCPQIPKSIKGVVQRKNATKILAPQIDGFYREVNTSTNSKEPALDLSSIDDLVESLEMHIKYSCPSATVRDRNDDFFASGIDSLQATRLSRGLNRSLNLVSGEMGDQVNLQFIYANPTLAQLADKLWRHMQSGERSTDELAVEEFEALTSRITSRLGSPTSMSPNATSAVILTGSTGSLGCYLLDTLMREGRFDKIYCLNRRPRAETTLLQEQLHVSKGLNTEFELRNVEFLQADPSQKWLGISPDIYYTMLSNVDYIIHNAWLVNWSAPASAFRPLLEGCEAFINFAERSPKQPRIIFMSSVGAVGSWTSDGRQRSDIIPEEAIPGMNAAENTAYSRSKLAAEHIFQYAGQTLGLPISICRVGQIAGPAQGAHGSWSNQNEWFPSLMKASIALGKLPTDLGTMDSLDWIPVDTLAAAIVSLCKNAPGSRRDSAGPFGTDLKSEAIAVALQKRIDDEIASVFSDYKRQDGPVEYLHFVNPSTTPWSIVGVDVAQRALKGRIKTTITLQNWVLDFKEACEVDSALAESPAAQLLDFYQTLASKSSSRRRFQTEQTCRRCPELARVGPIRREWLMKWINGWITQPTPA